MPTKNFFISERAQLSMRISKSLIAILSLQLFLPPAHATDIPTTFSFRGSGYGHGVGMSQIGARSMALAGQTPISILQYYYSGVEIESLPDTQTIRVNIGHLLKSIKIATSTPNSTISAFISNDKAVAQIPSKSSFSFSISGSQISLTSMTGKKSQLITRNREFTLRWSGESATVSVTNPKGTLKYRYGQIQLKSVRTKEGKYFIEATNSLRLHDEYLYGIGEVPSSWPAAALQAQAIASRTYALSKIGTIKSSCDCNLYDSISDQSFIGFAKESEPFYGKFWKEAVDATMSSDSTGIVVTMKGLPITAYFSSSSGGQTESAINAWGSERLFALSVPDSASVDIALNPRYAKWDRTVSQEIVAAAFLLPDVATLEIVNKNSTGTVAMIRAVSSAGVEVLLRGETFRSRTKIPSAWFELVSVQN
jgi:SpoIID/LytB domain protein